MSPSVRIQRAHESFSDWDRLLTLLRDAFAETEPRIDPPSSVMRLTPAALVARSHEEALFLAQDRDGLVGCIFAKHDGDAVYVSKLAVCADRRRDGIGRGLMAAAEDHARRLGARWLTLETRIELTENHATFGALGFVRVAERAHAGYDRPTFIEMHKDLAPMGAR